MAGENNPDYQEILDLLGQPLVNLNGTNANKTSDFKNDMTSKKPEFETETIHPELLQVPFSTLPETKVQINNKENSDLQKSWGQELADHIKNNREEKTNPRNLEFPREHPPEYLNVPGWKDCLGEKNLGSHSVVCLPSEKPENCLQSSWDELKRIWTSEKEFEKCDESEEKTNPGNLEFPREHPPEYLNVPGWKDCLGEKQLESHSVVCIPSEQPENCLQNSWHELIRIWTTEKEFDKCDESEEKIEIPGNLPIPKVWIPDYLNVSDWKGCLGERQVGSHSVVCFPSRPPPDCNGASWVELRSLWTIKYSVSESEFEVCEHPDHVDAPTEYLSVFGWFYCLGEKQNGSHSVLCDPEKYTENSDNCFQTGFVCLPSQKPNSCFQNSWEKLKRIWASDPSDWEFGSTVGPHEMCDESEEKSGNSWLPEPNEKKEIPQIMINKNQQVQLEG